MGRHSASGSRARHGLPAEPTAAGAAMFVGRVGAMALALGVGAAIAGGAGIAHADGTTDHRTSGSADTKSSSSPKVARGQADSIDGTAQLKLRKPRLSKVLARIPHRTAAPDDDATDARTQPRVRTASNRIDWPATAALARPVTARDDAVDSFARAKVDEVTAAFRGDRPPGVVPRQTADTSEQHRVSLPPAVTAVSGVLNAFGFSSTPSTGDGPVAPTPVVLGALQLLRREIDRMHVVPSTAEFTAAEAVANANPAEADVNVPPTRYDDVRTAYGDIGKWMLESNGDVSDYGGQQYNGKALLEPVNVIIVDPAAKSPADAARRLNTAMFWAGFPAQPIHSTGFQASIDDITYDQQPTILLSGYSDNLFIFPNNHGRIFGPDPVKTDGGYVWSGAFSTEEFGFYQLLPAHTYVSSDLARTALAMRLILSGQATFVGMVPLDNAYNTETTTTGDHDGYAVVLQLR